ncbi:hypothetical protein SynBMKMC1_02345 [Synechococcus sp. BMK-MC-1]|nr:hypothetical protein SynBMKMC1_02345 [Synechococcus sp. BMK-MC-1]
MASAQWAQQPPGDQQRKMRALGTTKNPVLDESFEYAP